MSYGTNDDQMSTKKKLGLIRRIWNIMHGFDVRNVIENVISFNIFDILMDQLNNDIFYENGKSVGRTIGRGLTITFVSIRFIQDNLLAPNYEDIYISTEFFDLTKSETLKSDPILYKYIQPNENYQMSTHDKYFHFLGILDKFCKIMNLLLILVNVYVSWVFLYGKYKMYSLFYEDKKPNSTNVIQVPFETLNHPYNELNSSSNWSFWQNLFNESETSNDNDNFFYKLNKWDPNEFQSFIFWSFSPINLLILLVSNVSFSTILIVILNDIILNFIVCDRYEQRSKDEKIIHSAVENEVNEKFLKPIFTKRVQDVKIDATQFDSNFVTEFYPAVTSVRGNNFQTHSLNGKIVTEHFNSDSGQFERSESSDAHNKIVLVRSSHN